MIRAQKLGHIVLKVRDAAKSRDFYVRTLGLKIASERLDQGMVFLSCGEQHHDLALFQLASGETPAEAQPGMHHMAWNVGTFDDLRDAYHELKAAGVEMRLTEHNVTRSIYVYDPDGNRVELYCDVAENANESGFEAMRRIGPKAVPMTFD